MLPDKNKKLIPVIIIIPILILVFIYINWLWPLQKHVSQLTEDVKVEKHKLDVMQNDAKKNEDKNKGNTITDVQMLPTEPSIDQLILLFKEAETKSSSTIASIEAVDQTNIAENKQENIMPEGVKAISYQLVVNSPNYICLSNFIKTIEQSDRIIIVNSENISSETGFNMDSGNVRAEITVQSFYNEK